MAKQKTRKSASMRFKVTKNGKVLRRVSFGRHLRRKKSSQQLRGYKKTLVVKGKIARKIKRMLAIA